MMTDKELRVVSHCGKAIGEVAVPDTSIIDSEENGFEKFSNILMENVTQTFEELMTDAYGQPLKGGKRKEVIDFARGFYNMIFDRLSEEEES